MTASATFHSRSCHQSSADLEQLGRQVIIIIVVDDDDDDQERAETVAESGEAEKRSAGCEASPEVVRGWGPRARARPEGGRPGCLAARRSSTRCRQVRWKAEKIWKPVDGRNRDGKLFEQLQSFFLTLLGIISTSLLLFVALRVLDEHGHVKYLISNRGQASLL